jgi:hypothetical protein
VGLFSGGFLFRGRHWRLLLRKILKFRPPGFSCNLRLWSRMHRHSKEIVKGNPDTKHISTSFAERNNLNVRMHSRRLTRLTNAFSKRVENHRHAMALHSCITISSRIHNTLRTTPAMAARVPKRLWEIDDLVDVLEAWEKSNLRQ